MINIIPLTADESYQHHRHHQQDSSQPLDTY